MRVTARAIGLLLSLPQWVGDGARFKWEGKAHDYSKRRWATFKSWKPKQAPPGFLGIDQRVQPPLHPLPGQRYGTELSLRSLHPGCTRHYQSDCRGFVSHLGAQRWRTAVPIGHFPASTLWHGQRPARSAGHKWHSGYEASRAEDCR